MFIKKIKLNHFRNYSKQEINLKDGINVIYGDNAAGKTNIIEAVFLCAIGKSFRTNKDKELIQFKNEKAMVEIEYEKKDRNADIKFEIEDKKSIFLNQIKLNKLSELIGNLNVVLFSPDDIEILKDGPSKRRKFLNILISQLRPNYIYLLNSYLKTLEQRNHYLRQIKLENKDEDLLDIWDEKLANTGKEIFEYRKEFIEKIKKKIKEIHKKIAAEETIKIKYNSDLEKEYLEKLKESRKGDIQKGFTQYGIHKDDFTIWINEKQVNIYGSQGQHRTAILSLKLSELEIVYDEVGEYPILLLDDFMSELDESRRNSLIKSIEKCQVIITCTDKIILENINYTLYKVENGEVQENGKI